MWTVVTAKGKSRHEEAKLIRLEARLGQAVWASSGANQGQNQVHNDGHLSGAGEGIVGTLVRRIRKEQLSPRANAHLRRWVQG